MNAGRRTVTVTVLAPVLVVLMAAAAFAFWKTTGSGSGNATLATTPWNDNVADTTAPTVAANCPTASASYATGNSGSSSWGHFCGTTATVTGTDNVAVVSAAIKVTHGTACFTGTAFTTAQCTAAGPSGYPAGYIAASGTSGSPSSWSVALTQARLATAGTGSYRLDAQAKDAAGNVSNTLTVNFTTT